MLRPVSRGSAAIVCDGTGQLTLYGFWLCWNWSSDEIIVEKQLRIVNKNVSARRYLQGTMSAVRSRALDFVRGLIFFLLGQAILV